ncbi:MAG: hypothetical protein RIG63_15245 [Coleofasciculus chthonoplastes F3-SA18-01]
MLTHISATFSDSSKGLAANHYIVNALKERSHSWVDPPLIATAKT